MRISPQAESVIFSCHESHQNPHASLWKYRVFKVQLHHSCLTAGERIVLVHASAENEGSSFRCKTEKYFLCFAQTSQYIFFRIDIFDLGIQGFKPIMRYLYCSSVRSAASCVFLGQDNRPASKRLYKSKTRYPSTGALCTDQNASRKTKRVFPSQMDF